MPRGDHKHLSMAYKHGYKLEQKNQRGASRALFARCSRVVRALFVRCSHPQFELLIFKLERHVETWRFALYHYLFPARCSLFVRVRTRCSYEFAYAVRALFVRCSYAVRTSSHERELTRELRDAPLWRLYLPQTQLKSPDIPIKSRVNLPASRDTTIDGAE